MTTLARSLKRAWTRATRSDWASPSTSPSSTTRWWGTCARPASLATRPSLTLLTSLTIATRRLSEMLSRSSSYSERTLLSGRTRKARTDQWELSIFSLHPSWILLRKHSWTDDFLIWPWITSRETNAIDGPLWFRGMRLQHCCKYEWLYEEVNSRQSTFPLGDISAILV